MTKATIKTETPKDVKQHQNRISSKNTKKLPRSRHADQPEKRTNGAQLLIPITPKDYSTVSRAENVHWTFDTLGPGSVSGPAFPLEDPFP